MRITLTRALAGRAIGDTIERSTKVAQLLIAHGAAVETEQDKRATSNDADGEEPKPKRTRRSASRKGKSDDESGTNDSDVSAGQEGGGAPPRSPSPTAG